MVSKMNNEQLDQPISRKHWLWVTRPEYYFDEEGNDREDLDPSVQIDSGEWWTCNKETHRGDLIFLWRTTPKKDIGYLLQAASDAYSIADNEFNPNNRWDYGCDYQPIYKFQNPITIQDFHQNPYLQDWGAYRGRFQRRAFQIPLEIWNRLNHLASVKNPGYRELIEEIEKLLISKQIDAEWELEETLVQNLTMLIPFGFDLELYNDLSGISGRQLICKGNGGRIDLLCIDRKTDCFVVIELKNVKAGQTTIGQITNYIGWVKSRIAGEKQVVGLVLSRGFDVRFESSMKAININSSLITQINIEKLGFS